MKCFHLQLLKPYSGRKLLFCAKLGVSVVVFASMYILPILCLYAQGLPIEIIAIDEIQVQACVLNRCMYASRWLTSLTKIYSTEFI